MPSPFTHDSDYALEYFLFLMKTSRDKLPPEKRESHCYFTKRLATTAKSIATPIANTFKNDPKTNSVNSV